LSAQAREGFEGDVDVQEAKTDSFEEVEQDVESLSGSEEEGKEDPPQNPPRPPTPNPDPEDSDSETMSTTAVTPFRPTKPNMGILLQIGTDTWVPSMGNVPKPDFSGLAEGEDKSHGTARQRPLSAKYDRAEYRKAGIEPKLGHQGDLGAFAEQFLEALFDAGSGVPAHLPNPDDPSKPQLNVLESHARYPSIEDAVELAKMQYAKFDEYDKSNDTENVKKLHASLTEDLLRQLKSLMPKTENNRYFAIHWLRLVDLMEKHTFAHLQGVQEAVKKLSPQQFPGEDITTYCTTVQ
jgi:hypothetical protein